VYTLYFIKNEVRNLNIEERSDVVYQIIELAKNNLLNEDQKQKIYDIVINLDNRTGIQKERFLLYYNLKINQQNTYRLCDLARKCNVSPNAIRCSVGRVRNSLVNLVDNKILKLQEILNEFRNN
jgi:hypothetical protein